VTVTVNGQPMPLDEDTSVEKLLALLKVRRAGVAVEVNRAIIPRARMGTAMLEEGDCVEIVTLVGGG